LVFVVDGARLHLEVLLAVGLIVPEGYLDYEDGLAT